MDLRPEILFQKGVPNFGGGLPGEIRPEHGLEQLPVIRHAQVQQFLHDHALAKLLVLAKQVRVEGHTPAGRATSPFAFHWPDVNDLWPHAHLVHPCLDLSLERFTRQRARQRLEFPGRGGSHGLALRSSFISLSATSAMASTPASISALKMLLRTSRSCASLVCQCGNCSNACSTARAACSGPFTPSILST